MPTVVVQLIRPDLQLQRMQIMILLPLFQFYTPLPFSFVIKFAHSARTALNHSDDGGQPGGVSNVNGMLLASRVSPINSEVAFGVGYV